MRNIKLILLTFALLMGGAALQGCTDPETQEELERIKKENAELKKLAEDKDEADAVDKLSKQRATLTKEAGELEAELAELKKEQSSLPPTEIAARAKKQEEIDKKQEELAKKQKALANVNIKWNAIKAKFEGDEEGSSAEDEAVD